MSIIIHCGKSGYNNNELEMRSKICGRLAVDMHSNKKLEMKSEVCGRLALGMHCVLEESLSGRNGRVIRAAG